MKMPPKLVSVPACLIVAALLLTGCSREAWYESVKRGAENDCRRQPGSAADDCLARLNNKSYDAYEKERSGSR